MITIAKTSEQAELGLGGEVIKRIRVVWYADANHGPYVDYFDKATFDGGEARRQLEQKAEQITKLVGAGS